MVDVHGIEVDEALVPLSQEWATRLKIGGYPDHNALAALTGKPFASSRISPDFFVVGQYGWPNEIEQPHPYWRHFPTRETGFSFDLPDNRTTIASLVLGLWVRLSEDFSSDNGVPGHYEASIREVFSSYRSGNVPAFRSAVDQLIYDVHTE